MNFIQFIRNFFGHLMTVVMHKHWVFVYCCKLGIPWQGVKHDLSKFSPVEFFESVRYYQGGKKSPIPVVKAANGYSKAWQHHKGRNPHHYEYWTDNYDLGTTCIEMPKKFVLEMVADWMAAGKTYGNFTIDDEIAWWESTKDTKFMHQKTKELVTEIFNKLKNKQI